jgi:hypothetical protein
MTFRFEDASMARWMRCQRQKSGSWADDDPSMVWMLRVQSNKMAAIQSHQDPSLAAGKIQYRFIRQCLISPACLLNRQYVIPQSSQFSDDRQGKVLI